MASNSGSTLLLTNSVTGMLVVACGATHQPTPTSDAVKPLRFNQLQSNELLSRHGVFFTEYLTINHEDQMGKTCLGLCHYPANNLKINKL